MDKNPQSINNRDAIVPIKGDPPVDGFIIFIKNTGSYKIITVTNLIITEITHNTANILCKYEIFSCEILNNIVHILFLIIGNKIDAKFKVIQFPSLIIICPLLSPKKEYINILIHHVI